MTELFIENNKLDITEQLEYLLTFSIDDIKDFSARNTTFSKTIILPGTARNNSLFGHIFDVRVSNPYDSTQANVSTNFNASVQADCLIFQNHVQIFKGSLRILEINLINGFIEYEVAVFGELGGFVASVGNARLEDLDFSAYDQAWTLANVSGSWDGIDATGVVFPLIDYGGVSVNKIDYDFRAFRPAMYVREYIDKIITGAGYSWESDLFNTSRFKSLIIPNNQKSLQKRTTLIMEAIRGATYRVLNGALNPGTTLTPPQYLSHETFAVAGFFSTNGDISEFTYTGSDPISTTFNIEFSGRFTGQFFTLHSKILKNGSSIYDFPDVSGPHPSAISFTHQVADLPVDLVNGDVLKIEFTLTNNGGGLNNYILDISEAVWDIRNAAEVWADVPVGSTIDINSTLPKNILQKDFLSSIVKLFNLYIYEDKNYLKKLFIKPYVDFFDLNVTGVSDWTYKIDRSQMVKLRPMSELNSRYYNFNFAEDSDYYNELYRKTYNETYGNYRYDSGYEFTNDKTDVDLIFSPTVLTGFAGADKIVSAMYKKNAGVEERYSTNIRILQFKKVTGVTGYTISDSSTPMATGVTNYGYAGHYDDPDAPANDIHFGVPRELYFTLLSGAINVTQFNVYWSPYMAEITDKDSKLMLAFAKLSTDDIFQLDFSKLKYVDGSYWRLNKIEDWNANDPDVCKIELLKVINLVY